MGHSGGAPILLRQLHPSRKEAFSSSKEAVWIVVSWDIGAISNAIRPPQPLRK
jgi:hypothetical protein